MVWYSGTFDPIVLLYGISSPNKKFFRSFNTIAIDGIFLGVIDNTQTIKNILGHFNSLHRGKDHTDYYSRMILRKNRLKSKIFVK